MKGQYFSFDAIVAAVIMVLAFAALLSYWYSLQYVTESRTYDMRADAMRTAEQLSSPGSPQNWNAVGFPNIRQIGLSKSHNSIELDPIKIAQLDNWTSPGHVDEMRRLFQIPGNVNYSIYIVQSDQLPSTPGFFNKTIELTSPSGAVEVASAYRGAVYDGHPVSIRVVLYR